MSQYIKLYNKFFDFVKENLESFHDEYERKLTNLILNHFDEIAETGTAGAKRAKLLNALIQREGQGVTSELTPVGGGSRTKSFSFSSITSLLVENFRGFSQKETILFDKRYTFIYGPNGSGKSSLCEALEYAMLGYINEAMSKRIDISRYIRNSISGKVSIPVLEGLSPDGKSIMIDTEPTLHHFCFIEKNRIEDFARISANTPSDKKGLLATLFGLDEFNDFVNNFTERIEDYIDTKGMKAEELKKKSEGLRIHRENIDLENKRIEDIASEKQRIMTEAGLNLSFEALDTYIHGAEGGKGRLAELDDLLSAPIGQEYVFPNTYALEVGFEEADTTVQAFQLLNKSYLQAKDKVQFRVFFDAAVQIEALSKDKCALCETPIGLTAKHPYENARNKLKELAEIAELEQKREEAFKILQSKLLAVNNTFSQRKQVAEQLSLTSALPEYMYSAIDSICSIESIINDYFQAKTEFRIHRESLLKLDTAVEAYNATIKELKNKKSVRLEEKTKLQGIAKRITEMKANEKAATENMSRWDKAILDFNTENAKLIKEVEEEERTVAVNATFVKAYRTLLDKLETYKNNLPTRHLERLNALTLDLYNNINMHDKTFEKASVIELPATEDNTINICFMDAPGFKHDALQILSEGHLRCLGLAILLAKNIHDGCPVVIFDDVVNAIDDDHKGGVREVIFNHPALASKQIILTTHAEQFIKELEQHPSKSDYEKLVRKYTFLPDNDRRMVRIKSDTVKNYLVKASECCDSAEWGEALYNCRCGLENIIYRLWNKLGRQDFKTEFSVIIRTPSGKPDLMSIVSSINSFLKKVDKEADKFSSVKAIFDYLLGLQSRSNIVWTYLNKGTHEAPDKPEFDPLIVKEIVGRLIVLDSDVKE